MTKISIQSPGGGGGTPLPAGNLQIKNGLAIDATLQTVSDQSGNDSALEISTIKVKAESAQQCPLEVESTGTGGGIALLDNTTTNNTSVGIGALGDNLCFRSGGSAAGNARLLANGNFIIDPTGAFIDQPGFDFQVPQSDAYINSTKVGRGGGNLLSNVRLGSTALDANTTGTSNTAIGQVSLNNVTTGSSNTALGNNSLVSVVSASNNTAIGKSALENNTAANNVAVGFEAALTNTTGTGITAIGYQALRLSTGNNNTALGFQSAAANTTGTDNTLLGYQAGNNITTGSLNVVIGASAAPLANTSSATIIGQASTGGFADVVVGRGATGGGNCSVLGNGASAALFTGCVVLGRSAIATANNQFVVGSAGTNAGAVTVEANISTNAWNVIINGVAHKILLA
jgi:hypothetical protein